MKKILLSVFVMLLGTIMVACGKEDSTGSQEGAVAKVDAENEKNESIEVDKGLLNVEIVLPASMFEGQDIDTVISEAKSEGVDEIKKNDDGSLTYKMSKSKHKEMMEEMKSSVLESIEETKTSQDFNSIKDVTYNKDFSEFNLIVDKVAFQDSFDGFAAMGLGMSGIYYQVFNGADPKTTVVIKDEATGGVIDTIVYPDAFNE
ncbi:hypothetical protein MKZ17_07875 [Solibacillus sp. FSL R7-0682]|uniref:hypothetical protein n=1 Tax=Solibacillus sp. FSL R7-0682 TaxID=2921690 RepID=UPI0030FB16B0